MRRTFSAVLAVLIAAVLVVAPAPAYASAGVPLPGPVDEIADIPSRVARSVTGSPIGDATARDFMYAMRAMANASATPSTAVATVPKPVTSPAVFARGAAGSSLFGAFLGGFMIGQGGLQLYGALTGEDPLQNLCGTGFEGVGSVMYIGMMPDCTLELVAPNEGLVPGSAVTYGGVSLKRLGSVVQDGGVYWRTCFTLTGTMPAGYGWQTNGLSGTGWINSTAPSTNTTYCGTFPAANRSAQTLAGHNSYWRIVRTADSVVVATEVTTTADPLRTPSCSIDWDDGTSSTGTGVPYRESEGFPYSASGMGCTTPWDAKPGAGTTVMPTRIGVESEDEAGAITEIVDQPVPEFGPDEKKAFVPGNGRGLVLEKVAGTITTSCMTWAADCSGWWDATDEGTTTGTYRCTYGGAQIALVECGAYRYTFDTQTSTPTITDPVTGTQTPWTTQPSSGNSINPGTGPGTGANPTADCFASGWAAFNPIEWVLTPVKCALVWAFVPRSTVVDAGFESIESRWQTTAIGGLATAVAGWSFVAPSSSGCDGITVGISELGHDIEDFQILNACAGEPLEPIAALSTLVIGIGAVLTAIAAVTGSIGGIVGQRALAAGPGA